MPICLLHPITTKDHFRQKNFFLVGNGLITRSHMWTKRFNPHTFLLVFLNSQFGPRDSENFFIQWESKKWMDEFWNSSYVESTLSSKSNLYFSLTRQKREISHGRNIENWFCVIYAFFLNTLFESHIWIHFRITLML